jgi:tetratricopeptide (TPR) repeat protein
LLIDRGKARESITILNKLEKIEGSNYEVFILKGTAFNMLGQVLEAQEHFDKAISLTEENKHEVLYNIAVSFEQQQRYETAIRYFHAAFELDTFNVSILYDLAYCYDHAGKYDLSIKYYEKFLDEDPFSDNAWFNLGTVYNKLNQNHKAIQAYDFAIAINEYYGSAYYNKGNILSNLEKYDEALLEYLEFLKIEEDHVMAHCYIGECYEKLRRFEESLFYFQKAVTIDSSCADAWFGKGIVKMHLESYSESEMYILKALDLSIDNTEYLYALGLVYMRTSNTKSGLGTFRRLIDIDPSDYEAWLNYSELFLLNERLDEAAASLLEASEYHFDNAYINVRLATYLFLQGNMYEGYQYLDKALQIDTECVEELYEFYPEAILDQAIKKIIEKYFNQKTE